MKGDIEEIENNVDEELLTSSQTEVHINELPEKLLLSILSYISHYELSKTVVLVCKKWRLLSYNGYLWRDVTFRPEYMDYNIHIEALKALISVRFANQLRSIDLPCEFVTVQVIHELASKCPAVKQMTIDFAKATQLNDFTDLQNFPSNLKSLCLCLSEVVFLEGFMRRVYTFLSSLSVLHIIGTFDLSSESEERFEVVNIGKIRSHTPNLTIVNFYGVTFFEDSHIEMLAASCIHLKVFAANYCLQITGSSLKHLTTRCKKLQTLLLRHADLKDEYVAAVDWYKCRHMSELDISCTDLSETCLIELLTKLPPLTFLSVAHCDFFTDKVLNSMASNSRLDRLKSVDFGYTYGLTEPIIMAFLKSHGHRLAGVMLNGKAKLDELFWLTAVPLLPEIRIVSLGQCHGWFYGNLARVHIDQIINAIATYNRKLVRLEIQWDPDTIRYSDKSSKFIDLLRMRCSNLRTVALADGGYYEMFRSNFDRAERPQVVRPTNQYKTSIISQLNDYNQLLFN
ncbi:F-box/LRR-repeat protein 2-like [Watersipora subatra]|uniref:F-box/LRR-repeat protein 2-like n=1 Tax=Watersipora subatra TaxID=2589382 RepID=UPI00355C4705